MGKVVGNVAGALALAALLHHLSYLRHNGLLIGGSNALSIEFAGPFSILALCIECSKPVLIDALRAGLALDLLLLALIVAGLFDLAFIDQTCFQKMILQLNHMFSYVSYAL